MILIVGAMKSELSEVLNQMSNLERLDHNEVELYEGTLNNQDILVLVSGIGKVSASMSLAVVLSKYKIKSIINVGIVGATSPYQTGQVLVVKQARYHDFDLTVFGYDHGQVPGHPVIFKTEVSQVNKIKSILKIQDACLYTGDSFMLESDITGIFDMEAAALYQVAYHFQINIVSIKVVSDVVGQPSQYENYQQFESECGVQIYKVLKQLIMEMIL